MEATQLNQGQYLEDSSDNMIWATYVILKFLVATLNE